MDALPELLRHHRGEFALVCNGQVWTFQSAKEASEAGMVKCTDVSSILVVRIEPPEEPTQTLRPEYKK
jgi:hypothetical protein